jgi:hypothetical protein
VRKVNKVEVFDVYLERSKKKLKEELKEFLEESR